MYTKNEFCRMTGITTQALRYYTQLGLVRPLKVEKNGYRKYDEQAVLKVWGLRIGSSIGIQLNRQIANQKTDLDGFVNWLSTRELELEKTIAQAKLQLEGVKTIQEFVKLEKTHGQVVQEKALRSYFASYDGSDASAKNMSRFVAGFPHSFSQINYSLKWSEENASLGSANFGLGIIEKWIDEVCSEDKDTLTILEPGDCLAYTIICQNPLKLTQEDMQPLIDYAKKMGRRTKGKIFCIVICQVGSVENPLYLLKCRVLLD